jgi:hypothetical protein
MAGAFEAQSLVETRRDTSKRRLEMTFVDADGQRQAISLPADVAADLVSVLRSLTSGAGNGGRAEFTRIAKLTAVGSAEYERLVLIRFDDDPPYGLAPDEAETLGREIRDQAAQVSRARRPVPQ